MEPLTREAIWNVTRNYEQRQQCLRTETDEVTVSAVSAPTRKEKCRACGKATGFNRATQMYFKYCSTHRDTSSDFSELKCSLSGCVHPRGNHNDIAHKAQCSKSTFLLEIR